MVRAGREYASETKDGGNRSKPLKIIKELSWRKASHGAFKKRKRAVTKS